MARTDADEELSRLQADLVSLVLQQAGAAASRDPEQFLGSPFAEAVRRVAAETVEQRLAQSPPPTAEDMAEQILTLLRDDVRSLAQDLSTGEAPRGTGRDAPPPPGMSRVSWALGGGAWLYIAVPVMLALALFGVLGFIAGGQMERNAAQAEIAAARKARPVEPAVREVIAADPVADPAADAGKDAAPGEAKSKK